MSFQVRSRQFIAATLVLGTFAWSASVFAGGRRYSPPVSNTPAPPPPPLPNVTAPPVEALPRLCQVPEDVELPPVNEILTFEKLPGSVCDTKVRNERHYFNTCISVAEGAGYRNSHPHYDIQCRVNRPYGDSCRRAPDRVFEANARITPVIRFGHSAQQNQSVRCQFLNQCLTVGQFYRGEYERRIALQWHNQWRCPAY